MCKEHIECKHCKWLDELFNLEIKNNREYWFYTEIFVYLHNGKDYCDWCCGCFTCILKSQKEQKVERNKHKEKLL